jgi:riboflavin biosynthesis pyrimidine reductase
LSLDLEGGGNANGSFLRAGLVDEARLAIFPAVDGTKGAWCAFDSGDGEAGVPAPVRAMTLEKSKMLEGGVVWLRYRLQST